MKGPNAASAWWRPGTKGTCWVCGGLTKWAWADLGYQHPDCEAYPDEDEQGNYVDVKIVRGRRVT